MKPLIIILASYLLGSIPFSYLFSKLKGQDVRAAGTKNVGASNALVVAGPLAGILALLGDVAKGYLAIQIARYFMLLDWGVVLCGLAAIAGHDFSVFLKFRGGKGVATTAGAVLAIDPLLYLIAILLWLLIIIAVRYFILSTLIILGFLPILMWASSFRSEYLWLSVFAFLLAVFQHREDIGRLISGKELSVFQTFQRYFS